MMMQELPLGQMNLSGPGELPPGHLDRLGNMKVEVGEVEAKPVWSDEDTKPPWARSVSPGGPHQMRAWVQAGHPGPRPEDYEAEERAKAALENGERVGHYLEPAGHGEEDHFPGYPPPHGSPGYHDGPGTPHDHHALHPSFSPETMAHHQNLESGPPGSNTAASKKSSSRRNAWGNLSYADLITQAILSSPEKRLTLSQVYDWMVQNIAYFKDKGDSNSSAGWKNSIRHNLSLHNKFIRVQNEGTGKSSWWMINAEAKSGGKSSRRRSSNPDNGKGGYDSKRRGRSKKSLDILRGGQESTPSPSGMPEGFPDSPLHPGFAHGMHGMDMRLRAGSNEFGRPCSPGGRIPHPGAEFFGGGEGWPGHPEQYGPMVQYGPAGAFRPPGYPEEMDPEMMARMGIDPRNMPPHLRAAYPFPHGAFPPDHPHYQTLTTMSPAHVPSLSPIPQHISPDHQQPPTPASAHEPLMSPHHLNQTGGVFFPGSGPHHGSCALSAPQPSGPPDSPAAGSSSSSGSILERALAKQEPASPLPQPSPHHPGHHHHPDHPMHHQGGPDLYHIEPQNFGDVNMEQYMKEEIKHYEEPMYSMEFPGGYPVGPGGHGAEAQEGHQYSPHPNAPQPWVR